MTERRYGIICMGVIIFACGLVLGAITPRFASEFFGYNAPPILRWLNLQGEIVSPANQNLSKDGNITQQETLLSESDTMSANELVAIRRQFAKCWEVPTGAKDLQVILRLQLNQNGEVIQIDLADESISRYSSGDILFRGAVESAMRAVRICSPLKNLPANKYQTWHDMIITFDPNDI